MSKKVFIAVSVVFVVFLAVFFSVFSIGEAPVKNSKLQKDIKVGESKIKVELLTTKPEWIQGLSGRTSLASSTGVLFVFDKPDYWGIWMKDMNFPIDVVWVTSDMKVSNVVEDMKVESYPSVYKPSQRVLYVIELPDGTIKENNIKVGQTVSGI